jgi:large subunit ribosomal protein L13
MPVIDVTGHVVGRLASVVAKRLLNGEEIVLVRAEAAILTGRRRTVLAEYAKKRGHGSTTSRMRGIGPFYPRRPDMILRRTISRMLPYQQARGRDALKRLRVYMDLPAAYKDAPLEVIGVAKRPPQGPTLNLGEVARTLGSKFGGRS